MKEMALQVLSLTIGGLEEKMMRGRSERVHKSRSSITARPKTKFKPFTPIVRNSEVTLRKNSGKLLVRRTCLLGGLPYHETAMKTYNWHHVLNKLLLVLQLIAPGFPSKIRLPSNKNTFSILAPR